MSGTLRTALGGLAVLLLGVCPALLQAAAPDAQVKDLPPARPSRSLEVPAVKPAGGNVIRFGFNLELTGDFPETGQVSVKAAELAKNQINAAGGLSLGGASYTLEFLYADNAGDPQTAVAETRRLIEKENVLAIVGPQESRLAIPAGETANAAKTPMISPSSTNYRTTLNRPYVFRACFLDSFQGEAASRFASDHLDAKTAAVLYDSSTHYSRDLAAIFKAAFEYAHGPGTVTAVSFTAPERNFSAQIGEIVAKRADVLFAPLFPNDAVAAVRQARAMGYAKPILGSDTWGSQFLPKQCGKDCAGLHFFSHFVPPGTSRASQQFVDAYRAQNGAIPDDVAALTYDAVNLLLAAIQGVGALSGDTTRNRVLLMNSLRAMRDFEGVTGRMDFRYGNDPAKCAEIIMIDGRGRFIFHKYLCP